MEAVAKQEKVNPMKRVKIGKVTLNIAVGKSGEALEKAARVLETLTGQKPSMRNAKRTIRDFGIHKGEPIAVIVTLRKEKALETLKKLLQAKGNIVKAASFDSLGNVSFGLKEHIDIPGMKYDPETGIFGMDISISLEKPGLRVMRRRRAASDVHPSQRVSRQDAIDFFKNVLGAEVT